jgi:hypothetical protein
MPRLPAARTEPEVPSRYRVYRLPGAKPTERGVLYRRGRQRYLLAWTRVKRAFAADVGEPGEPRVTVFDLAIQVTGSECVVCRLVAEPGEQAIRVARAIELAVGSRACSPCIQALAVDGLATRAYPDLDVFSESVLEAVRFG